MLLQAEPNHLDALLLLATLRHEQAAHQEALDLLARALACHPGCYEALLHQGLLQHALQQPEKALASYDQALAIRPDSADALHQRGRALQALDQPVEALASYDRALSLRPRFAEAHNSRGDALRALDRHNEALASYQQALAVRPDYAQARYNRGVALDALNRHADAVAIYGEVVAGPPDSADAHCIRGNSLHALERYEEAVASFDRALAIQPQHVEALNNRGNAQRALGQLEDALASYDRALSFLPGDAEAHWNASLACLALGDYERGWAEYEWRWQNRSLKLPRRAIDRPLWLGQDDIAGKAILVHPEQGIGDTIQMVRYVPLVAARGARVIVACHAALHALFRTVEGVSSAMVTESAPPPFDYHIPIMSLPRAFGTVLATLPSGVPYLHAPEPAAEAWRKRLARYGARPKVGLVWAGNPKHARDRARSIAVERLAPLVASSECAFFSLQKGAAAAEVTAFDPSGKRVADHTSELETFADTAALIAALDLVISVDTAVAHLAGAQGKPVWILLPLAPDWRWMLGREDSPWYPTARLFRQPAAGDWDSVLRRVARELERFAA